MIEKLKTMKNNYLENRTITRFQIVDAEHEMYHIDTFETEQEARSVIESDYQNRSKNDGYDDYWRNRKQVVIKRTIIIENLG